MIDQNNPSFREAMLELKRILDAIEDEDTDLDDLSQHVERAADLIRFCRQRIFHTEMKVQQIISQLDDNPPDDDEDEEEDLD
jgi:exodeoxyribonuclease VII small subunit